MGPLSWTFPLVLRASPSRSLNPGPADVEMLEAVTPSPLQTDDSVASATLHNSHHHMRRKICRSVTRRYQSRCTPPLYTHRIFRTPLFFSSADHGVSWLRVTDLFTSGEVIEQTQKFKCRLMRWRNVTRGCKMHVYRLCTSPPRVPADILLGTCWLASAQ